MKALVDSYFQALDLIAADKTEKSYGIMGADVKQTRRAVRGLESKFSAGPTSADNAKFFDGEFQAFNKDAAELLLEIGVIKQVPDSTLATRASSSDSDAS